MRGLAVTPMSPNSIRVVDDVPEPPGGDDLVQVRVIRVGLCGTDAEIAGGQYGKAPQGSDYLVLGHENFGVVEKVGRSVTGLAPGDHVVSTVRRPGDCPNCRALEYDRCLDGNYTERGIFGANGYIVERYSEHPWFMVKVPPASADHGVLVEPLTVVEKAVGDALHVRSGILWQPRLAVVAGAGPIGLLATALLRLRGIETIVVARSADGSTNSKAVAAIGGTYWSTQDRPLTDITGIGRNVDIAIEATGATRVAFDLMRVIGRNGVLALTGVFPRGVELDIDAGTLALDIVLHGRMIFGSVNANLGHFRRAVADLAAIEARWPGWLSSLITHRLPLERFAEGLDKRDRIKAVIEMSGG